MGEKWDRFGETGDLKASFDEDKIIRLYNVLGECIESFSTKEQVQELIDFLEDCKKEMEE
ncbi:hypothetical protein COD90_25730 [Bacillus cereus]|uniref:hypothetical protein n=1 Tax=Bacillus sp. OE TaxID=2293320 RepID=UPI000BFCE3D7|nr:hypothetical protein COD90_25730 [Bacillus cereus]RFB12402.1 hypothetical protein DZB88_16870 [Bacillus sp. OE]